MNKFGGDWTSQKIEIVTSYAKAYLTVMKGFSFFKLIYFDGFAGSGQINSSANKKSIEGAALRIISIDDPKSFDIYYFVELDKKFAKNLELSIREKFPSKRPHVVAEDCNKKLKDLARFLNRNENKNYKVLAFIDPKGMQVEWSSIEALKGLGIDMWILVPTGMGVNRLLKNNGEISNEWIERLEKFLGLNENEIRNYFYKSNKQQTLFGEIETIEKEKNAINVAAQLYKTRLNEVFKFVSEPFVMRNSTNSPMFHFYMATNNKTALKIANDVIKPKFK
jgi:three-Cys-motif partner protein